MLVFKILNLGLFEKALFNFILSLELYIKCIVHMLGLYA